MECELKIIKRNAIEAIKALKTWHGIEAFLIILLVVATAVYVSTITVGITIGIFVIVLTIISGFVLAYWSANTECKELVRI